MQHESVASPILSLLDDFYVESFWLFFCFWQQVFILWCGNTPMGNNMCITVVTMCLQKSRFSVSNEFSPQTISVSLLESWGTLHSFSTWSTVPMQSPWWSFLKMLQSREVQAILKHDNNISSLHQACYISNKTPFKSNTDWVLMKNIVTNKMVFYSLMIIIEIQWS